jgi:hypothetical protein
MWGKNKKHPKVLDLLDLLADRGGFEPPIRFERIHAFQACAFNHSATCPFLLQPAILASTGKRQHPLDITGDRVHLEINPLADLEILQGRHGNRVRNQIDTESRSVSQVLNTVDR